MNRRYYKRWTNQKKRLRNKRRNRRCRRPLEYRIIADTNIWYLLQKDEVLFNEIKNKNIIPNYLNVLELCDSKNLITTRADSVQNALQKIFCFEKKLNMKPPFVEIAQLSNSFEFNGEKEFPTILQLAKKLAHGGQISPEYKELYRQEYEKRRISRRNTIDFFNKEAVRIQKNIHDKKAHREKDSVFSTINFINMCVELTTNNLYNIKNIDLNQIELLILTLDVFFKALETGEIIKMEENDWIDIEMMGYVRPGDKYWTKEKKWIEFIKRAGCKHYLYEI